MENLIFKKCVITGGSSGIGHEFLKKIRSHFKEILVLGRQDQGLQQIENLKFLRTDLAESISSQINDPTSLGPIDLLFLCAGSDVQGRQPFLATPWKTIEDTLSVNFLRNIELLHLLLPGVLKSQFKTVVIFTSSNVDRPPKGCLAYSSAKTGLRMVIENLRLEYADQGLRVIEVCPGITKTSFAKNRIGNEKEADEFYQSFKSILDPSDVAQLIFANLFENSGSTKTKLEILPA
jgi:short-subunit dehydrogenase